MAYLETPAETTATDEIARIYQRDRDALGYVANYTKVFALRPEVLEAWRQLNGAIKAGMDPRRYEIATVGAAKSLRSSYCALAHGKILAERDLTLHAVTDLLGDDGSGDEQSGALDTATSDLTATDRAVYALGEKVAAGAADLTAADLEPLRELGLSEVDLFDIVLAAAARCFFSSVLEAVGAEPDSAYAALPEKLRTALTVGRAIEQSTAR